jgi:hypothetical protein
MAPVNDDQTIGSECAVLRVLLDRWITTKAGRTRPSSDSLLDSNFENSCFVEGEMSLAELRLLFPGRKIARIPVRVLRGEGYCLERRPEEAPEKCSNPSSHVVCGPPDSPIRGVYEAKARRIVKSTDVTIL